jgi:hypothetical protein
MNWKWQWPDLSHCPFIYLQLPRKAITLECAKSISGPRIKVATAARVQQERQTDRQTFVGSDRWWVEIQGLGRLAVGGTV